MPPKPSPSGSGKRRASDAAGGPQQTDLRDAFGVSPKLKRKGLLAAEAPLEVQVTPRQYDAFTVKFLETEGTARGFSAADKEEDARRSGTERKRVWGGEHIWTVGQTGIPIHRTRFFKSGGASPVWDTQTQTRMYRSQVIPHR
jgi:hypothetical protein